MRRTLTVLLLVSFSSLSIPAQEPKRNPEEKPRKIKQELKKAYVEWINDHDLILTQSGSLKILLQLPPLPKN